MDGLPDPTALTHPSCCVTFKPDLTTCGEEIVFCQTHFGSQRHINAVTQRNLVIGCRVVVDYGSGSLTN